MDELQDLLRRLSLLTGKLNQIQEEIVELHELATKLQKRLRKTRHEK